MVNNALKVLRELSNEARYIEKGIYPITESKVVSLSQNLNTVRKGTLSANTLLEGGTGSSSAVDLSIK